VIDAHLAADPGASRKLKASLGISENYYTAVPHDQLTLCVDVLKRLTPRGRGEYREGEVSEPSEGKLF